jgi:hypothetical protein
MRMIYEEDIEQEDFIEMILTENEYVKLEDKGLVIDFPEGLKNNRNLNVFIRVDRDLTDEDLCH